MANTTMRLRILAGLAKLVHDNYEAKLNALNTEYLEQSYVLADLVKQELQDIEPDE